eukprot:scaffold36287_cov156-Isochrysis_galbana.AAC.1
MNHWSPIQPKRREHRDGQAGEGGVGVDLRGGGTAGADGRAVKGTGGGAHRRARGGVGSNGRAKTRQGSKCGKQGGWVWRT